jgi:hypothetical protein
VSDWFCLGLAVWLNRLTHDPSIRTGLICEL